MGRLSEYLEPDDPRGWDTPPEDLIFGRWTRLIVWPAVAAVGIWFWWGVWQAVKLLLL